MPNVTTPQGLDLGDITDPVLLAYYIGEGCTVDGPKRGVIVADAVRADIVEKPLRSATKAEWADFALTLEPNDADAINAMTHDELVEKFDR